jgi:hypothetical protein
MQKLKRFYMLGMRPVGQNEKHKRLGGSCCDPYLLDLAIENTGDLDLTTWYKRLKGHRRQGSVGKWTSQIQLSSIQLLLRFRIFPYHRTAASSSPASQSSGNIVLPTCCSSWGLLVPVCRTFVRILSWQENT